MNELRKRLETIIRDSSLFSAGQQEERRRLCRLIDIRIDQLRDQRLPRQSNLSARCEELLIIRQQLHDHQ